MTETIVNSNIYTVVINDIPISYATGNLNAVVEYTKSAHNNAPVEGIGKPLNDGTGDWDGYVLYNYKGPAGIDVKSFLSQKIQDALGTSPLLAQPFDKNDDGVADIGTTEAPIEYVLDVGNELYSGTGLIHPTCFYKNTLIITDNGKKRINQLKRGDMIQTLSGFKPLARLMKNNKVHSNQEWVRLPAGCFGPNSPSQDLLCTKPHPLVRNHKLCSASEFVGRVPGIEVVTRPGDQYNLLFEDQEYIMIQGVCVVSHHPHHPDKSLQLEEYFNPLKYRPGVFNEQVVTFDEWMA